MKLNYSVIFTIVLFICACKSKEEELKEKMIPVIRELVLQDSTVSKLDSIIIYKLDTLTDLNTATRRVSMLTNLSNHFVNISEMDLQMAQFHQSSGKSRASSARLYYSVLDSKTLGDIELGDAKEEFAKSNRMVEHSKLMLDSSDLMTKIASKFSMLRGKRSILPHLEVYTVLRC